MVTLACLLPFADKAIHIDDPLFVWAGRQMQIRWWDPYGFDVNWYGWKMPMHQVTKNPPLASAFIALLASIFHENEFMLHVGFLLQAIAVILGTYVLGRRLCDHPLHTALATLFAPAFMVSSTSLMCDVLMVAFWVWAIVFWIRGLDKEQPLLLLLASLFVSASSLAKYFGFALIPLLLVYTLNRTGKPGWWLIWFLIPIVVIASYEAKMRSLYGHGLIWDAFNYASGSTTHQLDTIPLKLLTALAFVGGCSAIGVILTPMLWRPSSWFAPPIAILILFFVTWIMSGSISAHPDGLARIGIAALWTVLIAGGLVILALPILDWIHHKNAESLLLGLWIWGTFAFCILNWTINGRSILPMIPAVAIILHRRIELTRLATPFKVNLALCGAAILSLVISLADYRLADAGRTAAEEIQRKFASRTAKTIWFQGHWGFQYYAQANGFRPLDVKDPQTKVGDILVLPSNNTNLRGLPENKVDRIATVEVPVTPFVTTMSRAVGAGFYADLDRPLPFAFGAVPPEEYYILRFK
jgi:hypothetical protein